METNAEQCSTAVGYGAQFRSEFDAYGSTSVLVDLPPPRSFARGVRPTHNNAVVDTRRRSHARTAHYYDTDIFIRVYVCVEIDVRRMLGTCVSEKDIPLDRNNE